jgi:peptidoglycan hydrolase CwlO-like protein
MRVSESVRLFAYLWKRIQTMSKQIDDLTAAVAALTAQKDAAVANAASLKAKLDAALAALAVAQAGALSDAEKAQLAQAVTDVQAVSQALADSTAITNPAN